MFLSRKYRMPTTFEVILAVNTKRLGGEFLFWRTGLLYLWVFAQIHRKGSHKHRTNFDLRITGQALIHVQMIPTFGLFLAVVSVVSVEFVFLPNHFLIGWENTYSLKG